jgi:predicted RNA-binding Zn ribbon-like protein
MDFLNTTLAPQGTPIELIGDGRSFVEWLTGAGLIDAANAAKLTRRFGAKALDETAAQARRARKWIEEWMSRWREAPNDDYSAELNRLNGLLEHARTYRQVVAANDGVELVDHVPLESPDELLALIAEEVGTLFVSEDPGLVKRCAGSECTLWFLDRTKAHRRLFCSAAVCGNRAKVAAFRERRQGGV